MIEVEVKFLIADASAFEEVLSRFVIRGSQADVEHVDEYFHHPCRDFLRTDEALRLRICNGRLELTYKGPRLDAVSGTREEHQLEIAGVGGPESRNELCSILLALGFRIAGCVRKQRRVYVVEFESHCISAALDRVSGLPAYVELEIMCEESERLPATDRILRFAKQLNLQNPEHRSYLELLGLR